MLNLVFPTNVTSKSAGAAPGNAAATALPAGFGVMVEMATGTATVEAATLVTGAAVAKSQTGQTAPALSLPFLGAGLQTTETLIPEGALVADPQVPGAKVAVPALMPDLTAAPVQQILPGHGTDMVQTTAQTGPVGEPAPDAGQTPITAGLPTHPLPTILPNAPADAVIDAKIAIEPQNAKPVGVAPTQGSASVDPSALNGANKVQANALTAGQQPQVTSIPASPDAAATAAKPVEAAIPASANLNAATSVGAKENGPVPATAPTAKIEAPTPTGAPQPSVAAKQSLIPNAVAAAAPDVQADPNQPVENKSIPAPVKPNVSVNISKGYVNSQTVVTAVQPAGKTVLTDAPIQTAPTADTAKPLASSTHAPVQFTAAPAPEVQAAAAVPVKSAMVPVSAPVAMQASGPAIITTQSAAQVTGQPATQQPKIGSAILAEIPPAQSAPLRFVEPVVTQPVQAGETQSATKSLPAGPVAPSTPEPKVATVAAPAPMPAAAPTTNEQSQPVTPITVAEKVIGTPATPAQITTIQAVTAQRNLIKPHDTADTSSKPAPSKPGASSVRSDAQQPVFDAPTGQQPNVQAKPVTGLATVAGPIGATFEPVDPILASRSDVAPVQGFDAASAAKITAPQDTAPKAPPKPFAEALISQVKSVEVSEGRTSVSLHPRGLGNIEIEVVTEKDTAAKIVVRVENPAVLQSLREERDLLAHAIGVSDSSIFEFQDHQSDDPSGGQGGQSQSSDPLADIGNTAETATQHTNVLGDGQLDILT